MTMKNMLPTVVGFLCIMAVLAFASITHANPSAYATTVQTAVATTSISYLVPGATNATTTLIYDSYAARPTIADKASLQVQFTASSTATTLTISYEYTNGAPGLDCLGTPASCDWYQDETRINVNATTSQPFSVNLPNSLNWTFASSSQAGGTVSATNNRALKVFTVPTPARYTRAIFWLTGTNGGIWAQMIPAKENN